MRNAVSCLVNMKYDVQYILSQVNDWLKFAEAKNGVLIAFDSGLLYVIFNLLIEKKINDSVFEAYLSFSLFILVIAIILQLVSFIPRLSSKFSEPKKVDYSPNLTFFGDISKLSLSAIEKLLIEKYDLNIQTFQRDLLKQIIMNSRIAMFKYNLFIIGIYLNITLLATPVLIIPLIIFKLVKNANRRSNTQ